MRKLLICLSLILVLTLVFVGCKNKNETPDGTTETPTTEAPTETPTEAPTNAPVEDNTTEAPTTEAPTTEAPTEPPVEECTHSFPAEWSVDESVEECAGEGRLYRECEACGEKETKADTCAFGEWTKVEGKECADEGRLYRVCSKCGKTEKAADGECTYGDAVVTEPTCEETGLSVKTCTKCGATEEETLDATGHVAKEGTEWNVQTAPTCTEAGKGFGECANCGEKVTVVLPATGHDANEATCSAPSVCATCGVEVAPALPHNTITVEAQAPTCTEVGYKAGSYCADCGSIDPLVIPATGHDHKWVVTTAPTFTADGVNTGTCACGDVVTDSVAKRVPALVYTAADLVAGEKIDYNKVIVTPNGEYVTLAPTANGAGLEFLLADGQAFQDVISIKYRVSSDFVSVSPNKDAYFNVNGKQFWASITGKNVVDYDNEGTAGEWTLLNIDLRKTQSNIDAMEYDMFKGEALKTIEYVLFSTYAEGLSIDIEYVAFFDTVDEAWNYAENFGEVATPVVYEPTEKNYNTSLNNTNGAGEYGAPGIYLNEKNNAGATIVDWSGRFFNNYNLTIVGSIAVEGGVQKIMYSLDDGLTWLDFAEGMATVADGTYTAKFDLSAFENKTVDIRIAAVLADDGKTVEYASVLNLKDILVKKGNLNDTITLDYLTAAGNQDSNRIVATNNGSYVHYSVSGSNPTITLVKNAEGLELGKYMLIRYRGNGKGYGTNYDFYFNVNGTLNKGGNLPVSDTDTKQQYRPNWFNLTLDGKWNYIIVDLSNGGNIDVSSIKQISWIVFDGAITEAKGNALDVEYVQFFNTYAEAKAFEVANHPESDRYFTTTENGSTITGFTYPGVSANNPLSATGYRVPFLSVTSGLLNSVTLVDSDTSLNLAANIKSNVTIPVENVGIKVEGYDVLWGAQYPGDGNYHFSFAIPAGFVLEQDYNVDILIKSPVNGEIILVDEFTLKQQPVGINISDADYKFDISSTIALTPITASANDVVALYKGDTLVMYYAASANVSGFKPNGDTGIEIVDANLAKLTTEGTYTVKLHADGINGAVIAEKTIEILDSGVVGNGHWTAQELYNCWKRWSAVSDWGFTAELRDDGQGQYVRFTANPATNGDGSRLILMFQGGHDNPGWDGSQAAGKYIMLKYRNHTWNNQVNICYGTGDKCKNPINGSTPCLCTANNTCNGLGYIGNVSNGWAMTVSDAWRIPSGWTCIVLRFQAGITIDIESLAIVTGWQGLGGNFDTLYGFNHN